MNQKVTGPNYFRLAPAPRKSRKPGRGFVAGLIVIFIAGFGWMLWSNGWIKLAVIAVQNAIQIPVDPTLTPVRSAGFDLALTATGAIPSSTATGTAAATTTLTSETLLSPPLAYYGTMVVSARIADHQRLQVYFPGQPRGYVLAGGEWDDLEPAVSPDGTRLAFRSNRDGQWDLYLINLENLSLTRLTDTVSIEAQPAWSSDGQWLCYEMYDGSDYEIWLAAIDNLEVYQLTDHPAADIRPVWDPARRQIYFLSNRLGDYDLYVARLDDPESRFDLLTGIPGVDERDPAVSPDGAHLAYVVSIQGLDTIYILDLETAGALPVRVGPGSQPAWSPAGDVVLAVLRMANTDQLMAYHVHGGAVPPLGYSVNHGSGITWYEGVLPVASLPTVEEMWLASDLFVPYVQPSADTSGRLSLIELPGVTAPHAKLSDEVDEAFLALRARVISEAGWDFLANLENAFVGINDPLAPGFAYNDWLYTGRAFSFDSMLTGSEWLEVIPEQIGMETYWRIFLRISSSQEMQGEPLQALPWDFNSRNNGQARTYDQGGGYKDEIPAGYYLDFTELAAAYGFERLPAMYNWRSFFPAARFNEFVAKEGLTWEAAMLKIYPAQAIMTPTPFMTPTKTPTRTPRPTATPWWLN